MLLVQVKMGQITREEMMEILNKDDRAAADKAFNSQLEGEAEFVYVCEKIAHYIRKHFCNGGDGRANTNSSNGNGSDPVADTLATIKIVRGAGADELEVPHVSTKLGIVTYAGQTAIINDDVTVDEMDEKEAMFVQQYRMGGIDEADLQEIMVRFSCQHCCKTPTRKPNPPRTLSMSKQNSGRMCTHMLNISSAVYCFNNCHYLAGKTQALHGALPRCGLGEAASRDRGDVDGQDG